MGIIASCDCQTEKIEYLNAKRDYSFANAKCLKIKVNIEAVEQSLILLTPATILSSWVAAAIAVLLSILNNLNDKYDDATQERHDLKDIMKEKKDEYDDCESNLDDCATGHKVKPNCLQVCPPCGESYCKDCYDSDIEAWENTIV